MTEELIVEMKRSGCYKIYISVESGNQDVLTNIIDKPLKLTQADNVIKWCRKHDVQVEGGFVLGLPGETKETMRQTVSYAMTRRFDAAHFFVAQPYPGTRLRDIASQRGYLKDPRLSSLKHNQKAVIATERFSLDFVDDLKDQAYRATANKYRVENLNLLIFLKRLLGLRDRTDFNRFKYYFFVRHGFSKNRLFNVSGFTRYFGLLVRNILLYLVNKVILSRTAQAIDSM